MFKTGMARTVITIIVLLLMTALFAGVAYEIIKTAIYGTEIIEAENYDEYVYMDAVYMSESFANDDDNEYVFATIIEEDTYYDYMVCLPKSYYGSDEVKKLIEHTYANDGSKISPLRIKGFLRHSFSELDDFAQESYSYYAGVDEGVNAADYLGPAYIEYSPSGSNLANMGVGLWIAIIFMIAMMIVWIVEIVRLIRRQSKKNKKIAMAKNMYASNADYQNGVRQTAEPDAQFFKSCKCYVTREYVVSYQDGLEVFRIDQIREMYGHDKQRYRAILSFLFGAFAGFRVEHTLVAITSDGFSHTFARMGSALRMHNSIVGALIMKNPAMTLGRQRVSPYAACPSPDQLNLARVAGFYGSDDIWTGRTVNSFGA